MIRITGNYTYAVSRKSGLYKLAVVKLERCNTVRISKVCMLIFNAYGHLI